MIENKIDVINRLKIRQKSAIDKLLLSIEKYNINYKDSDGDLSNVVFTKDDKVCKIAYEIFYRYSGICAHIVEVKSKNIVIKEIDKSKKAKKKKTEYIIQTIEDSEFYDRIKMIILLNLGIEYV